MPPELIATTILFGFKVVSSCHQGGIKLSTICCKSVQNIAIIIISNTRKVVFESFPKKSYSSDRDPMRMSNAKASGRNSDWEDHKIKVITKDCSSRVAEAGHSGCGHWSVYIALFCGFHRVWIRYSTFSDVIQSLDATWDFSQMLLSSCEGLGLCQRSLYLSGPSEFFFLPAWFFSETTQNFVWFM